MTARSVGYARLAAGDGQEEAAALRAAGCDDVQLERVTGTRSIRPVWVRLRAGLADGDTLTVVRLADLHWALVRLVEMLAALQHEGVRFRSITESIDSNHPGYADLIEGLMQLPGQVSIVRSQAVRSSAAGRARGRQGGRTQTLTPEQAERAQRLYDQREMTAEAIAAEFGISRATLYRYVRPSQAKKGSEPVMRTNERKAK
ncbi:recombinase family protein [Catellatospora sp. NPDC049133]|uniref:recombinase family protein n=1 Tax=Catellatospora sp. NPDC049133 TaxID=3155499 RepID=UPI00340C40C5